MTYLQFYKKYKNLKVDLDNYPSYNPYQCYDLFGKYHKEVVGAKTLPYLKWSGGAKDLYYHFDELGLSKFYTKIPTRNKLGIRNLPKRGDVIVWGGMPNNDYGHVAICHSGWQVFQFVSFDQNWPLGSPAHLVDHNYWYVRGYLRPKS